MTNKVSSKGIPFQNKCQLVLDDEIRAIYDELNPPESPLWYQFGVGQGNGTTVVIFPAECEGSYTESEYQAFLEDCSTLESVGYAIQRANFGRSEGLVVLYLRLGDGDVTGEEEGGLLEWVHQVLPAGATHLWEDIREIDSRVLQFSLPVFHSSEVEYLEKALKALKIQDGLWMSELKVNL